MVNIGIPYEEMKIVCLGYSGFIPMKYTIGKIGVYNTVKKVSLRGVKEAIVDTIGNEKVVF